jgi:hypothetical protein
MAKKTTAVAKTTPTLELTPENVTSTIDNLRAQLAKLKSNVSETVSTDISYTFGNGSSVNIKDVTKVGELLEISSSIEARSSAYDRAAIRHKVEGKVKPFSQNDKNFDQWMEIIDKAIFELINKKQIEQIESAIKRLSKFEDEKTQLQREFEGIVGSASELLA